MTVGISFTLEEMLPGIGILTEQIKLSFQMAIQGLTLTMRCPQMGQR